MCSGDIGRTTDNGKAAKNGMDYDDDVINDAAAEDIHLEIGWTLLLFFARKLILLFQIRVWIICIWRYKQGNATAGNTKMIGQQALFSVDAVSCNLAWWILDFFPIDWHRKLKNCASHVQPINTLLVKDIL